MWVTIKDWFLAATIRAIKTFGQSFVGTVGGAAIFTSVNMKVVALSAAFAMMLSYMTSLQGLPELKQCAADGVMKVDTSDPLKDTYNLVLNGDVEDLAKKDKVTFTVQKS
jgi:hypothetical protein